MIWKFKLLDLFNNCHAYLLSVFVVLLLYEGNVYTSLSTPRPFTVLPANKKIMKNLPTT